MGVRGLTTYIANRSDFYLKNYELNNSRLVIDGNSLACQLYKWHSTCNDCFGGDYDKYGRVVHEFFQLLSHCRVVPIVVFDGGYEKRKLKTVCSRMKDKLKSAARCAPNGSASLFPLFLRNLFEDIVRQLKIQCVRCNFEADTEIASLAKSLNCPVLSYDSDFYIFDALYIPFSTFDINKRVRYNKQLKRGEFYIQCKIYEIDVFLNAFGGMDKANLPILSVLLGNDYIKSGEFYAFFGQLKLQKSKNDNPQQRKIKTVISWLRHETYESALKKIAGRFKANRRRHLIHRVMQASGSYTLVDSEIINFLNIDITTPQVTATVNDIDIICDDLDEIDITSDEVEDEESLNEAEDDVNSMNENSDDGSLNENEITDAPEEKLTLLPEFVDNFRKCFYPPCFMDMITLNKYYFTPQIEDNSEDNAHRISWPILAIIYKILTSELSEASSLIFYDRNERCHIKKYILEKSDQDVPSLKTIYSLSSAEQRDILYKLLRIDQTTIENLQNFPKKWHLILITMNYWIRNSKVENCFIYAIILSCIVLFYIDKKIGFYRSRKVFVSKYGELINKELSNCAKPETESIENLNDSLGNISLQESILCMHSLISYFQIDGKTSTNVKFFDRNIVHRLSEFQSCLLHVTYLNALLNKPIDAVLVSEFYNGTFLYNILVSFKKRTDLKLYIKLLLKNSPHIVNILDSITDSVTISNETPSSKPNRRRRKRKKKSNENNPDKVESTEELNEENRSVQEGEIIFDENNSFSILSSL